MQFCFRTQLPVRSAAGDGGSRRGVPRRSLRKTAPLLGEPDATCGGSESRWCCGANEEHLHSKHLCVVDLQHGIKASDREGFATNVHIGCATCKGFELQSLWTTNAALQLKNRRRAGWGGREAKPLWERLSRATGYEKPAEREGRLAPAASPFLSSRD